MRASVGIGRASLLVAAVIVAGCGTETRTVRRGRTGELVVRDFCTSFGRQRGFAFLNLFADSARLDIAELKVSFVGREDIERLADYGVAVNARLTAGDFRTEGETVFCRVAESNDWLDMLAVRSASEDPKALERLLPGGRPTYDATVVPELMRRLRQWRTRLR